MDSAARQPHGPTRNADLQTAPSEVTPLIGGQNDGTPLARAHNATQRQDENVDAEQNSSESPLKDPTVLNIIGTMSCLWLSVFIAALDSTVVATLSTPISSSFKSGTSFTWIASGYLISNAACQPMSGKLTDIYGRRAGLVFASTFFGLGTLICGIAPNASIMILGRVVAGTGGGCINVIAVFIGSDMVPLRKRGVLSGLANVVWGLGTGLGGLYGGFISDRWHWRYVFLIQLPFIVLGAVLGVWMIKLPPKRDDVPKRQRVDVLGALTLTTSLVLVLLGLSSGGNIVPFNHPLVYGSLSLGVFFLAVFIYVEEKVSQEPIIPVSQLFNNRTIAAACLAVWFQTMSMFMLIYYIPIYFQVVRHVSVTKAGAVFIPQSIGTALGSLGAGFYIRATGQYRLLGIISQVVFVVTTALIFLFFNSTPPILPYVLFGTAGLAYGIILTVAQLAMISTLEHKWQAVVTATSYAFRSTGSTIGIAIGTAIFQNLLRGRLKEHFGNFTDGPRVIRKLMDSFDYIDKVPRSWKSGIIESYINALDGVWLGALVFAALTFIASAFLRQNTLYNNIERSR